MYLKYLKVIAINVLITGIFLISPAVFYRLYQKIKPVFYKQLNPDIRAYYPTYKNKKFSVELFNELREATFKYRSFIGWRRDKINFKYTNILGSYNARKSTGEAIDNSAWFFGGSTMWGSGVSDSQTIPSHFNSLTNISVYNFGETGWNSRQSLNQLINAIGDNHKPSTVIFFDGVNDVSHQCRKEYTLLPSHSYELTINNSMKPFREIFKNKIFKFLLFPIRELANKFNIKLLAGDEANSKTYDCDINQEKAKSVAEQLVNNWYTAYALSKSKSFEFYGILQPTLFTTKTNTEYFPPEVVKRNSEMELQYRAVYPLILREIDRNCKSDPNFCSTIIDGTDWLNGKNNIFIDFCHINSVGNEVVAQRLNSLLNK